MNELVPFEFASFKAAEAVWPDPRSVRFPRAEVGRLFRGDHGCHSDTHDSRRRRPQNLVQILIKRNPHLQTLGIPLTVRGVPGTRGDRPYTAVCYSLDEIHELAIHSTLPGARRLLHIYPILKEAEVRGRFVRHSTKDARARYAIEQLDRIVALPWQSRDRRDLREALAGAFGRSLDTISRWQRRYRRGEIPPLRKGRNDKGKLRKCSEEVRQRVQAIAQKEPGIKTVELWQRVGKAESYSTIHRWRRQMERKEIAA